MTLYELIGILGAALYLGSYALLQYHRSFARNIAYSLMNFSAAACVLISLFRDWNLASCIIQVAWLIISSYGIYRCLFSPTPLEDKTLADQPKES